MSSLNARQGWKYESAYGNSSNVPSENLDIALSSNMPTSPLIPGTPTLALRNIGDWYDSFNGDGGPFTSHGQTVHSDVSSVTIPVREPRFQIHDSPFLFQASKARFDAFREECSTRLGCGRIKLLRIARRSR